MTGDLPYVDEQHVTVAAPRPVVWAALRPYAGSSLVRAAGPRLAWLLGTDPPGGFEVAEEIAEERLALAGRHRFARYRLVFDLADAAAGETVLTARTFAEFPGPHGFAYRTLVIGSRGHVLAVRRMLTTVRRAVPAA